MIEVHTSSKPGRPALLLTLSALALAGTLGLAWWQTRARRALADEVRIAGTPLVVRPPKGWIQDQNDPGAFSLPLDRRARRRGEALLGRRVSFEYYRRPAFVAPQRLLRIYDLQEWAKSSAPVPARVGPLTGIQVRRLVRRVAFGRNYLQEQVLRLACSPRGDVIIVKYVPLTGLTVAQLDFLEEICAAIRIDDPAFTTDAGDLLRHAGLELPVKKSWTVCGPDYAEVPGVFLQGTADGQPAWALGVFRSWLANSRSPADLVVDFAGEYWRLSADETRVARSQRPDGAAVAAVRHPAFGRSEHIVASVWAVARGADQAALIFTFSGPRSATVADEAARGLAAAMDFRPTAALPALGAARAAGRDLAAILTRKGAVPWWGALEREAYYLDLLTAPARVIYTHRVAVADNAAAGYRGQTLYLSADEPKPRVELWTLDERARGYTYRFQGNVRRWDRSVPLAIEEHLDSGSTSVTRSTKSTRPRQTRTFSVSPLFVRPPVESIAEAWVAYQPNGAWLIEATTHFDASTHTRLLRPLPPDREGRRRLLLMLDFWPRGTVLGFDENRELRYQLFPAAAYRRASAKAAMARFPSLAIWRRNLMQLIETLD